MTYGNDVMAVHSVVSARAAEPLNPRNTSTRHVRLDNFLRAFIVVLLAVYTIPEIKKGRPLGKASRVLKK
jgi:hypothetical protein